MSSHHRSRDRSPVRRRDPRSDRRSRSPKRDERHLDRRDDRPNDRSNDRHDERYKRRDYDRPRSRSPMRRPTTSREYNRRSRSRSPSRRDRQTVPFGQRSVHVDPERHIKEQQARAEAGAEAARKAKIIELSNASQQGDETSEMQLMALMGLPSGGFNTTKFKKVADGNVSGVKLATKRKARQYMNRPDNFHKLLEGQGT